MSLSSWETSLPASVAENPRSAVLLRPPVHIIVVDDRAMLREAVVRRIQEGGVFRVVSAITCREAIRSSHADMRCELILIFVRPEDRTDDCCSLIRKLRANAHPPRVVVSSEDETAIVSCLEAGASGYVDSGSSWQEFEQRLIDVYEGRQACSPQVLALIIEQIQQRVAAQPPPGLDDARRLSPRETDVARLMTQGRSNKEISSELKVSLSTAKNHVHNILQKLGVKRRNEVLGRSF